MNTKKNKWKVSFDVSSTCSSIRYSKTSCSKTSCSKISCSI